MSRIDRLVLVALLQGGAPVLLFLLGLFGFIELAEQLEDVGKGTFGTLAAMQVTALRLPALAVDLLPVVCLLGVLVGLGPLAAGQELVALGSAGLGPLRIVRTLLVLLLVIVLGVAGLAQWVLPGLDQRALELRARTLDDGSGGSGVLWTRAGDTMVRIGRLGSHADDATLADVSLFRLDPDRRVVEWIEAPRASVLGADLWRLEAATITTIRGREVAAVERPLWLWRGTLADRAVLDLLAPGRLLAPVELLASIRFLAGQGLDTRALVMALGQWLGLPLGVLAMGLFGLPFVMGDQRSMPQGTRLTLGVLVGVGVFLLDRTAAQVGLLYALPPLPMAVGPEAGALLVALAALRRVRG